MSFELRLMLLPVGVCGSSLLFVETDEEVCDKTDEPEEGVEEAVVIVRIGLTRASPCRTQTLRLTRPLCEGR
jgi:hypothetical protein